MTVALVFGQGMVGDEKLAGFDNGIYAYASAFM